MIKLELTETEARYVAGALTSVSTIRAALFPPTEERLGVAAQERMLAERIEDAIKASAPRDCTCTGTCKGADGLAPGWRCAMKVER